MSESDPESLWVFGGAEQSANRNCVQVVHTSGNSSTVLCVDLDVGCITKLCFYVPVYRQRSMADSGGERDTPEPEDVPH